MKTVVKAYIHTPEGELIRTLLDSEGRVYVPKLKRWVDTAFGVVATVPGHFESWSDVPASWIGHTPYWK